MRNITTFLSFILISLSVSSAQAMPCYSMAEMEAEQGLRIHSELMVISLNCQHMLHDRGNLYILYREFTRKHQGLLSDYERRLLSFFQREGSQDPERSLHTLRTELANQVAQDAADTRPDIFCHRYSDRVPDAIRLTGSQVKSWAAKPQKSKPVSRPMCANANKGYNKG